MKLKPLGDKIVVERLEAMTQTAGGIFLPDSAQEKPQEAKVVAVGPGRTLENGSVAPLDVKVGDSVLFGKYGGTEITVDGKELLILKESDILAKSGK